MSEQRLVDMAVSEISAYCKRTGAVIIIDPQLSYRARLPDHAIDEVEFPALLEGLKDRMDESVVWVACQGYVIQQGVIAREKASPAEEEAIRIREDMIRDDLNEHYKAAVSSIGNLYPDKTFELNEDELEMIEAEALRILGEMGYKTSVGNSARQFAITGNN